MPNDVVSLILNSVVDVLAPSMLKVMYSFLKLQIRMFFHLQRDSPCFNEPPVMADECVMVQ